MKHIKLGDLDVSRIGLGLVSMSDAYTGAGTDDAESIRTIHRALELGVTFLDTAEVYGPYINEELLGKAIKGRRDQVVVATKFGVISHARGGPGHLDSSPANIRTAVEGSLKRLGTDYVDLYYQHRVDPTGADRGHASGRWPNWSPRARSATSACPRPARRRSAGPTPSTRSPPSSRSTPCGPGTRRRGCCRVLRELNIGFVPYSPLGRGFLTGKIRSTGDFDDTDLRKDNPRFTGENLQHNLRIVDKIRAVAAEASATPAQVALAWLLTRGDDVAPIPGTKRVARVEENTAADAVELTAEQIEKLNNLPPAVGDTHNEAGMRMLER